MRVLEDAAAALQAGEPAPDAVLEALAVRGARPADVHQQELAAIARWVEEGRLAAPLAELLATRLRALQGTVVADDLDDATVVHPLRSGSSAHTAADPDATVVLPGGHPRAPADEDVTRVQPRASSSLPPVPDRTGTAQPTLSQSDSADSWKRVAEAEPGDHVTVGSVLKGRFHLEKEIGRGGMGVVFLARDERKVEARDRDPYVAVKVLNDDFRRHPDSLIALQRESRRSQALAHDNIVRVYDFDKDGATVFMTMEYVDGCDLKTLIRERAYSGMPLKQARPLIEGMALALKRAHDAGVVHSDFKPANVMVTRDGVPKVFDFGIARAGKHMGDQVGEQTVFDAGTLGALTPAYASLEMIQGKEPTPSDDIYALGCVAFELLTGRHPFDKVSAEVAMKEGRQPPAVPGLTKRQRQALNDAVAFSGERRLKGADQLLDGLREITLRQRVGPLLAYGALVVAVLAIGAFSGMRYLHARHVQQIVARFNLDDPHRYGNEDLALGALGGLDEADRQQLMLAHGDVIQRYLLGRLDAYWNPAQGHYDYPRVQHLFALRERLQLYLPQLDLRRAAIEKERAERLLAAEKKVPANAPAGDAHAQDGQLVASAADRGPGDRRDAQPRPAVDSGHLQDVALKLTRDGERNFARQNYSAAIANAQAALAVKPGDARAQRLLDQARQAQRQAMNSISIQ